MYKSIRSADIAIAAATMSAARTTGGGSNQLLQVPAADANQQQLKPKRKAPARPGNADKSKTGSNSSNKTNTKVKRKTSLQEVSSVNRNAKVKRRTSDTTSPIKEEGENNSAKAKRKVSPNSITEENGEGTKDNKLRRIVSPRKEQYSHLLDEMVGCGDMVLLEPLTEENIIENLKKRYAAGDIYVRAYRLYIPVSVC